MSREQFQGEFKGAVNYDIKNLTVDSKAQVTFRARRGHAEELGFCRSPRGSAPTTWLHTVVCKNPPPPIRRRSPDDKSSVLTCFLQQ